MSQECCANFVGGCPENHFNPKPCPLTVAREEIERLKAEILSLKAEDEVMNHPPYCRIHQGKQCSCGKNQSAYFYRSKHLF
jgi:hypothetical protein